MRVSGHLGNMGGAGEGPAHAEAERHENLRCVPGTSVCRVCWRGGDRGGEERWPRSWAGATSS